MSHLFFYFTCVLTHLRFNLDCGPGGLLLEITTRWSLWHSICELLEDEQTWTTGSVEICRRRRPPTPLRQQSLAWIMYLFLLYTTMYDGQSWTAAFLTTVSLGWWDVPYTCIVDRIRTARAGGCGPPDGANVCNDRYHFSMSITVA